MKRVLPMLAAVLSVVTTASTASPQSLFDRDFDQAAALEQTAYVSDQEPAQGAAAGQSPFIEEPIVPKKPIAVDDAYDAACDCASCRSSTPCCCPEDPWRLFPRGLPYGITVHGWVSAGVSFNGDNPPSNFNGLVTFNDRHEDIQLNQLCLVFERAVDTGGFGWDIGGRVDLLYGTDSRFVEVNGLGAGWNAEEFYGLAMPQLYLEAAYNNLSVKMGHFYTIVGLEGVMAPDNFFYSHAYTMQYGEPFTHTGLLASYALRDRLTVHAGFDRGWNRFNPNPDGDNLNFLGGVAWDNGRGRSVAATVTTGLETANPLLPRLKDGRYLYSLVVSQELGNRWTYVIQHDCGNQSSGSPFTAGSAEWYGINQYLFYMLNPSWTLGVRGEWFRDDDGLRVGGIGGRNRGSPIAPFGFAGNFYNVTFGANWQPNDNLTVRPEIRFDWYDGVSRFGTRPFNDGRNDEQFTFGIDLIYLF